MANKQTDLCNVGACWPRTSEAGNEYFAIRIDQDIPAGTWIKGFWKKHDGDTRKPVMSLVGTTEQGFKQYQEGQGQGQRQQGQPRQQQQQQYRGQGQGGNSGGRQQQQSGRGGYQNHNRRQYRDDINAEEIPF